MKCNLGNGRFLHFFSFLFPEDVNLESSEGNIYCNFIKTCCSCHLSTNHFLKILFVPVSVYTLSLIGLGALFFFDMKILRV